MQRLFYSRAFESQRLWIIYTKLVFAQRAHGSRLYISTRFPSRFVAEVPPSGVTYLVDKVTTAICRASFGAEANRLSTRGGELTIALRVRTVQLNHSCQPLDCEFRSVQRIATRA